MRNFVRKNLKAQNYGSQILSRKEAQQAWRGPYQMLDNNQGQAVINDDRV